MKVKINTREKFHAITMYTDSLTANMTEEMDNCLLPLLEQDVKNTILIMKDIKKIDDAAAGHLAKIQQSFYEANASFVICELNQEVEEFLDKINLLEVMNVTPTENEASDIVLMEEIERDLMT